MAFHFAPWARFGSHIGKLNFGMHTYRCHPEAIAVRSTPIILHRNTRYFVVSIWGRKKIDSLKCEKQIRMIDDCRLPPLWFWLDFSRAIRAFVFHPLTELLVLAFASSPERKGYGYSVLPSDECPTLQKGCGQVDRWHDVKKLLSPGPMNTWLVCF